MLVCTLAAGVAPASRLQSVGGASPGIPPRSDLGEGDVRGQVSLAVSTSTANIDSVEAVKELSSQGIPKPPSWVGQKVRCILDCSLGC
jgi:hypothetical protein